MEGRTTMIRPAPWPLYDTEKVARWLEKMARQGFVLTEHGFPGTLPLAIFQKTNRQNLRYCLVGTVSNAYAPEHLIVSMRDAWGIAAKITAAGSVFIGNYSPESAGDYASGTNHTLPTGGWARACSGVNVDSFMRKITFQELTRDGLDALAPAITAMAEAEGLDAHANAVRVRMKGGIL